MSELQTEWRNRAAQLEQQLAVLLNGADLNKTQLTATHALIMRELLPMLADFLDVLEHSTYRERMVSTISRIAARNNSLRTASAKGDWDAVSRILDEETAAAGVRTTEQAVSG